MDPTTENAMGMLTIVTLCALWFAPCLPLAYVADRWMGKSAAKVMGCGLLLGPIGSVVAMICLPKKEAEQAGCKGAARAVPAKATATEADDAIRMILYGMAGIGVVIGLAMMGLVLLGG
jgi:hypothetical protein